MTSARPGAARKPGSTRRTGAARGANSAPPGPVARRGGSQDRRLRALRERAAPAEAEGFVIANLRFRLPRRLWVGAFSGKHPEVRVEYLNYAELDPQHSVSDCWISGHPAGRWSKEIAEYSDVRRVENLAEMGRGGLYRVTYRNPPVVHLYRELGVPLPVPIWMQAGVCGWEVAARRPEFLRILAFARSVDPKVRIVSVHRGPLRRHLPSLTDPEHQMLTAAMGLGYFDVPRRLTLEDLAQRLGRPRSSVGGAIAAIESKLLDSAFTGIALRIDVPRGDDRAPPGRRNGTD